MNESRCNCDWATGECQGPVGCQAVNSLPALVKALEDLQETAGAVATWINHWGVPFADRDEWRGPTGDGQSFFNALNQAAAALAAYRGSSK